MEEDESAGRPREHVLVGEDDRMDRREAALASVGFAIVGFCVGLSFTVRGAGAADIANPAAVLPLLLLMLAALLRQRAGSVRGQGANA